MHNLDNDDQVLLDALNIACEIAEEKGYKATYRTLDLARLAHMRDSAPRQKALREIRPLSVHNWLPKQAHFKK